MQGLLILSRRLDEDVLLDFSRVTDPSQLKSGIVIRVINIRGEKIRLGFKAPGCVRVDRREVAEARENDASLPREAGSDAPEVSLSAAYRRGVINGVTRFAYYKGTTQIVGNKGYKLADAIADIERELSCGQIEQHGSDDSSRRDATTPPDASTARSSASSRR